jgi:hypothetical protein
MKRLKRSLVLSGLSLSRNPSHAWFFSQIEKEEGKTLKAGDMVTIQIMRVGKWNHPEYGEVEVTKSDIQEFIQNFEDNVRQIEIAVDENHEPDHRATGWYRKLFSDKSGKNLYARIEITKMGADLLNDGAYKYFSPEFALTYEDPETGDEYSNLLIGGAFTNRPFFKGMQPLMASEVASGSGKKLDREDDGKLSALFFSDTATMRDFMKLLQKLADKEKISASEKEDLEVAFAELPKEDQHTKMKAAVDEICARFSEDDDDTKKKTKKVKMAEDDAEDKADGGADEEEEDKGKKAIKKVQAKHKAKGEAIDDVADEMDESAEEMDEEEMAEDDEEAPEKKMSEILAEAGINFGEMKKSKKGSVLMSEEAVNAITSYVSKQQKIFAQAQRELRMSETKKELRKLKFSDTNTKGILLPKDIGAVAEFSCSLSKDQAKKFMDILTNLQSSAALLTRKVGGDGDLPASNQFSEETKDTNEVYRWFCDSAKFDEKEALAATKRYYADMAKRK